MSEQKYFRNPAAKFLLNIVQEGDGLELLRDLKDEVAQLVIFDPQYKNTVKVVLGTRKCCYDKDYYRPAFHKYENLDQDQENIKEFVKEIERILKPSGFLIF